MTDKVEGVPVDAGKLVLSATRTYAPIIKKLLDTTSRSNIHGLMHCSVSRKVYIYIYTYTYIYIHICTYT